MSSKARVGVLLSRVRVEEKLLLAELESRGVEAKVIDDRELVLAVEHKPELGVDVVLERCIQHGTALYALSVLDTWGVPTVNRYEVAEICGNKLLTTMRLIRDGVPSPRTRVAFTPGAALAAIQVAHPMVMWMFAETPRLAEDWAYRWLAASIRLENRTPLDERDAQVLGQRPTQAELPLGPTVVDAAARRSLLAREAESGTIWTSRSAAEECRVAQPTAAADLKRLVTQGVLRVEGGGRSRTYRAVAPRMTLPNASR